MVVEEVVGQAASAEVALGHEEAEAVRPEAPRLPAPVAGAGVGVGAGVLVAFCSHELAIPLRYPAQQLEPRQCLMWRWCYLRQHLGCSRLRSSVPEANGISTSERSCGKLAVCKAHLIEALRVSH